MNKENRVILVNQQDQEVGSAEKMKAHELGQCHRAFSVFIFLKKNEQLELLIQQRHDDKYHCGGLWTNTCCSHPRPNEKTLDAANRRLFEEVGIKATLKHVGEFHYIAHFDNGLTENEYDHVFVGFVTDKDININKDEIKNTQWIELAKLENDLENNPGKYTPWFMQALSYAKQFLTNVNQ